MQSRTLRVIPAENVNDDTPAPAEPDPLFLQLQDGSTWFYRIGGARGGRADGLNPAYGCINKTGVCATQQGSYDTNNILVGNDAPMIDRSGDPWQVRVGLTGDPSTDYPAPTWIAVSRAWFIAGHRWQGD